MHQNNFDNFTHFKFDTSNNETYARSNRNKLPQIGIQNQININSYRVSSLDQRIDNQKYKKNQGETSPNKDIKS